MKPIQIWPLFSLFEIWIQKLFMKFINTYYGSLGSGQEVLNAVEFINFAVCSKLNCVNLDFPSIVTEIFDDCAESFCNSCPRFFLLIQLNFSSWRFAQAQYYIVYV